MLRGLLRDCRHIEPEVFERPNDSQKIFDLDRFDEIAVRMQLICFLYVMLWGGSGEYDYRYVFQVRILFDLCQKFVSDGGGAGIRTLGGVAPTTIFETVPFNRSGTPPKRQ